LAPTGRCNEPAVDTTLWNHCLRRLEAELPEQQFNTWIRPLQAVEEREVLDLLQCDEIGIGLSPLASRDIEAAKREALERVLMRGQAIVARVSKRLGA
jgi:hypothetical protein